MNKRIEVTPDSSATDCISDAFRFIVDGFINSGNAKSQDLKGIGLLGSYNRRTDIEIVSDIEAIQAANRGISTKNLPYAENRGFGIITSKKMVIDGLKGIYAMISGKAMLLKTPDFNQYLELSPEIRINGTIVILRMPFVSDNFNYVSYIE